MNLNQPVLFVPHGAPTFALRPGAAGAALVAKAATLALPRAIVIVSAHWDTAVPTVGFAEKLETIHDFWGFPEALYAIRYPATGCPEASREVVAAIAAAGLPVATDATRGLDHGAWVPLRLMFPDAEVPVIPLSVQSRGGAEQAYRLGQALAPLAAKGFLIIGSGSITHNLRDYQGAWQNGGQTPAYVREFADWLADQTTASCGASAVPACTIDAQLMRARAVLRPATRPVRHFSVISLPFTSITIRSPGSRLHHTRKIGRAHV